MIVVGFGKTLRVTYVSVVNDLGSSTSIWRFAEQATNRQEMNMELISAVDQHIEIIEGRFKTDINIDPVNRLAWPALLEVIILEDGGPRHMDVLRLLVGAEADVNLADGSGVTPLEHARRRGFEEMVTILEEAQ